MALCHITGTVYLPSGEVAASRQVVFRREVKNITAEYLGAVFPDDVTVYTGADGGIDVRLLTGRYVAFAMTTPRSYFGVVTVPAATAANFADIIGAQELPDTAPVWYEQALAARDEAASSAINAGTSADQAANSAAIALSRQPVTPMQYGAVGDGVADDTAAVQQCLTAHGRMTFPEGRLFRVMSPLLIPPGLAKLEVTGPGGILFAGDATQQNLWNFANYNGGNMLPKLVFKGFSVRGTHDINRSNIASFPMLIIATRDVEIIGCEVSYSRVMGIAVRSAQRVLVQDCHVHHCARDGINVAVCGNTSIIGNDINHTDDDAIAVHNSVTNWYRGHVVSGNRIRKAQGIRALGVNNISITGNVLEFYIQQGVDVSSHVTGTSGVEGVNATFSVNISGNVFSDPINRTALDGLNNDVTGIMINGRAAQAGTLERVPGVASDPLPYMGNVRTGSSNNSSTPVPISSGIIVSGNVFKRTIPRSGMFSSLGFGLFWMRDGELDYDMGSEAANFATCMRGNGGHIENVMSSGNIYSGFSTFFWINDAAVMVRGWHFKGDIVSDIYKFGVNFSSIDRSCDVKFENCVFDLDPYHVHSNRNVTGGWVTEANGPVAISTGISRGYSFTGCEFKNMARIADTAISTKVSEGRMEFRGNRIWGQPSAHGFSSLNGGVGRLEAFDRSQSLVNIICDPASPDYGRILRRGVTAATDLTSLSGFFVMGERVERTSYVLAGTAPNRYLVTGWVRLTTGSGHVLGTDWVEERNYIGS